MRKMNEAVKFTVSFSLHFYYRTVVWNTKVHDNLSKLNVQTSTPNRNNNALYFRMRRHKTSTRFQQPTMPGFGFHAGFEFESSPFTQKVVMLEQPLKADQA